MAETPKFQTKFHAHLDECERCRNQPFNLCAWGAKLFQQAVMAPSPTPETET